MYENDPADIADIGWDKFVGGIWESIFVGYHSNCGIRTIARRWSDLLQAGLGCSEEVADELVRAEIMDREDRAIMSTRDAQEMVEAMDETLADMGLDLPEMGWIPPEERSRLIAAHTRLRRFLREASADAEDPEAG